MSNTAADTTDVRVSATIQELALGRYRWAPINAPTTFIALYIITPVDGREIETRIRVASEAINQKEFLRHLGDNVLASIRRELDA